MLQGTYTYILSYKHHNICVNVETVTTRAFHKRGSEGPRDVYRSHGSKVWNWNLNLSLLTSNQWYFFSPSGMILIKINILIIIRIFRNDSICHEHGVTFGKQLQRGIHSDHKRILLMIAEKSDHD